MKWNGKIIFSKEYVDYIDELWNYFFDGLVLVNKGEPFSTYLSGQPVKITFELITQHTIQFSVIDNQFFFVTIPKQIFIKSMVEGFTEFIEYLPTIAPKSIGWSNYMKSELKKSGLQK